MTLPAEAKAEIRAREIVYVKQRNSYPSVAFPP